MQSLSVIFLMCVGFLSHTLVGIGTGFTMCGTIGHSYWGRLVTRHDNKYALKPSEQPKSADISTSPPAQTSSSGLN